MTLITALAALLLCSCQQPLTLERVQKQNVAPQYTALSVPIQIVTTIDELKASGQIKQSLTWGATVEMVCVPIWRTRTAADSCRSAPSTKNPMSAAARIAATYRGNQELIGIIIMPQRLVSRGVPKGYVWSALMSGAGNLLSGSGVGYFYLNGARQSIRHSGIPGDTFNISNDSASNSISGSYSHGGRIDNNFSPMNSNVLNNGTPMMPMNPSRD